MEELLKKAEKLCEEAEELKKRVDERKPMDRKDKNVLRERRKIAAGFLDTARMLKNGIKQGIFDTEKAKKWVEEGEKYCREAKESFKRTDEYITEITENSLLKADRGRDFTVAELPEELKKYCYDCIYELATQFNHALSSGFEYVNGFNKVMDSLSVPKSEREKILLTARENAETSGISYYNLSPVNQYLVTVVPYVYYCLQNRPPSFLKPFEIKGFMDNEEFIQYLFQLGIRVSKKVKGALWRPGAGCLGKAALIIIFCSVAILAIILLF